MYSIRSSLIHHGNRKDFKMDNLRQLQICLFMLITTLINKSHRFKTKQDILSEIDEAINQAY
jgi:hypothetical protein